MSTSVETEGTSHCEASSASQGAAAAATSFLVRRRAARPRTRHVARTQKTPRTCTGRMDKRPNKAAGANGRYASGGLMSAISANGTAPWSMRLAMTAKSDSSMLSIPKTNPALRRTTIAAKSAGTAHRRGGARAVPRARRCESANRMRASSSPSRGNCVNRSLESGTSVHIRSGISTMSVARSPGIPGAPASRRPISSTSKAQRAWNGSSSAAASSGETWKAFAPHWVS